MVARAAGGAEGEQWVWRGRFAVVAALCGERQAGGNCSLLQAWLCRVASQGGFAGGISILVNQ